jgi:Tfp pilus assembly protein PilO
MNLVGKIFTVLILVMSLVFMSFAVAVYATHKNWKTRAETDQEELKKTEKENKDKDVKLKQTKRDAETQAKALDQLREKLATEKETLEKNFTTTKERLDTVEKDLGEKLADLKVLQTRLAATSKDNEDLRARLLTAENDRKKQFEELLKATDEMNQKANEVLRLTALQKELADQYAKAKQVLRIFDLKEDPGFYDPVPPVRNGLVNADPVRVGADELVQISLGSDDGLRAGHLLEVSRGGRYVGRIQVTKTYSDRSVCKVIREFLQSQVQKDDRVDTKQR